MRCCDNSIREIKESVFLIRLYCAAQDGEIHFDLDALWLRCSQVNLCREDKGKRKTGCLNPVAGAAGEEEKGEERGEGGWEIVETGCIGQMGTLLMYT